MNKATIHIYLHAIGNFIRSNAIQHQHLLESIQIRVPVTRQWFLVWLRAVKHLLKAVNVAGKLLN